MCAVCAVCVACGLCEMDNTFDNVGCIFMHTMHTFGNWQCEHVYQFFFRFTLVLLLSLSLHAIEFF